MKLIVLLMFNKFTGKIENLLTSKNFIQLRNTVIILSRLIKVYPNTKASSSRIVEAFKKKFDKDQVKGSLHTQAQSYKVALINKKSDLPSIDVKSNPKIDPFRITRPIGK